MDRWFHITYENQTEPSADIETFFLNMCKAQAFAVGEDVLLLYSAEAMVKMGDWPTRVQNEPSMHEIHAKYCNNTNRRLIKLIRPLLPMDVDQHPWLS